MYLASSARSLQVSGSDTSEDEARADWVDLRGLGQGHYCGYLQKKSRRDSSLWRRRWCILAVRGERENSNSCGRRKLNFNFALIDERVISYVVLKLDCRHEVVFSVFD